MQPAGSDRKASGASSGHALLFDLLALPDLL
jgi:hypothetical protein